MCYTINKHIAIYITIQYMYTYIANYTLREKFNMYIGYKNTYLYAMIWLAS